MRIILSPAKKMRIDEEAPGLSAPSLLEKTAVLEKYLRALSFDEAKALWKCSDKLVQENLKRIEVMDLHHRLTAALFAYDGLVFQHIGANIMTQEALDYLNDHLRILSGFYGVLKPSDGITPYRLEMQNKGAFNDTHSLYDFWEDTLYKQVIDDDHLIINLASKEYAKCITNYLQDGDRLIEIVFGEMKNGKLITKATKAKMARGEMVRYMALNQITDVHQLKNFQEIGFIYNEDLSTDTKYVYTC